MASRVVALSRETVAASQDAEQHESERALVRRARLDPDAFAELYLLYAPRIFRYLCSRSRSEDEAADLTQHVFVRVFASLNQYRERRAPFAAWLFRIARNAATDVDRRRRPLLSLEAAEHIVDTSADPHERAVLSEDLVRLRLLVAKLPEPDRDLLALRFAGRLTGGEIASLTGRSKDAVRKQLWRIVRALKEQYHDTPG